MYTRMLRTRIHVYLSCARPLRTSYGDGCAWMQKYVIHQTPANKRACDSPTYLVYLVHVGLDIHKENKKKTRKENREIM